MSYLPNQRTWFYVSFALKDSTGATTTINCSNSAEINDGGTYYPILKGISGVSADMGAHLPLSQGGAIILDNSPGSFGYERRFSDLLERLRIIDTEVTIYGAETAIDDTSIVDGFNQLYKARVQRWSYDVEGESLNIQIASAPIRKQVMTKIVDSVSFPSAPDSSLGRHLPIVIGDAVDVLPVLISAEGDASPDFAYASTLADDFISGGVQAYYAKNDLGRYVEVASAGTTSTILFGNANESGKNFTDMLYGSTQNDVRAVKFTATTGCILTHVSYRVRWDGSAADTGAMFFQIRRDDLVQNNTPTRAPGTIIGRATYYLGNMSGSAGTQDLEAAWEQPIVISPGESYYLVTWAELELQSPLYPIQWYFDNAVTETGYQTIFSITPEGQWIESSSASERGKKQYWQLYGAVLTDTTYSSPDSEGLGFAKFEITQRAAPTGFSNPDLTKLGMIVAVNGLLDNGAGDITGAASTLIERPDHALMLLDKEWDGSAWDGASGRIDSTAHSASHAALSASTNRYYRKIAGRSEGRATVEQICEAIAENAGVRLALTNSTTAGQSLGVYVWGTEIASSATFTDETARVLTVEQRGTETIVNRIAMYFDRKLRELDIVSGSSEGAFRNYAKTVDWTVGTNTIATALAGESQDVFGVRPLAESSFDWLNDTASAEVMASYFMSVYAKPHTFVTFEVPMFRAWDLNVLDVVTVIHPALSAYFGTSSLGTAPSYDGDPADPGLGQYLKRAKSYRAQIEGRALNFNFGDIPTIRLTCRILDNYPADPT